MQITELEHQMLELGPRDRARLAQMLWESLETELSEQEIEELWLDEAERRNRVVAAGKMELLPGDEVMKEARARCVLQQAVADAERGIAAGEWVDHGEISAKLQRWAGDEDPE